MDRDKIIKMIVILAAIVVIAGSLSKVISRNSMSLSEYAQLNNLSEKSSEENPSDVNMPEENVPEHTSMPSETSAQDKDSAPSSPDTDAQNPTAPSASPEVDAIPASSLLTGASLNGNSQSEERVLLADGFYYEPLSDNLRRYMTGISYPATGEGVPQPEITFDELRYVHILHYDFEGNSVEGELVCNEFIAQDLTEIFYELYRNEYRLEKVLLIDEYDGDDNASMEDNNTSCFNYRPVEGSSNLSKHAFGLAIDINPLYNPYITYAKDGSENILPVSAAVYADRSVNFPYKIDENDLCYKLFIQHGFTWGGNWNNVKDYQHFQKAK